MRWFWQN